MPECLKATVTTVGIFVFIQCLRKVSSLWACESDFQKHPIQEQDRHIYLLPIGQTSQFIQQEGIWQ